MRRGSDQEILEINGKFVGFTLGADYCAEHEWGIQKIKDSFQISTDKGAGVAKRIIHICPPTEASKENHYNSILVMYSHEKDHYLMFTSGYNAERYLNNPKEQNDELRLYKPWVRKGEKPEDKFSNHMQGAWDEKSFGIHVDDKYLPQLTELFEAFKKKDIVIFLGGGHVFQNAGLAICIASRLSKDITTSWENADNDRIKLLAASKATGIEDILKKAGKSYFACSPRWVKDKKQAKTAYDVCYWLNPMQQQIDNYGQFTVEELKLWADNKGPIPMKKK